MKKVSLIILSALLVLGNLLIAQTQGPAVKWTKEDNAPSQWNGQPKLDPTDPNYLQSDDWWYAHTKVYENGVQIGYAAAGYSTWADALVTLGDQSQCYEYSVTFPLPGTSSDVECKDFETVNEVKGAFFQTIALYNMEGEMQWCKRFNAGEFHDIIQDDEGKLVAYGQAESVKYLTNPGQLPSNWIPVGYNPNSSNGGNGTFVTCANSGDFKQKSSAVKVDLTGVLEWNFMYGYEDVSTAGWKLPVGKGWGLTEYNGGYRLVGNNNGKGLMVQINKAGQIIQKDIYDPVSSGLEFFQVAVGKNDHIAVTGLQYSRIGSAAIRTGIVYHFPPTNNAFLKNISNYHQLTSISSPNSNTKTADIEYLEEFDLFAVPLLYNNTELDGWNGKGDFEIQFFNFDFDPLTSPKPNTIYAGAYIANDLKMGVADIEGGFVTVSTQQPGGQITAYTPNIWNKLDNRFPAYDCDSYYGTGATSANPYATAVNTALKFWNSDASVARYDINQVAINLVASKRWEKTFDFDADPRENYPGDIKKQECLYTISTDDRDGSVVIAGNNSNNLDDAYLAKLYPDHCIGAGLVYDIENTSTGTFEINSNTMWDNTTSQIQGHQGELYVKGEVVVKSGWTLTITTNQVFMAADNTNGKKGRFFIEKGARLIIDGATITSDKIRCPEAEFEGIRIDGDNNSNQVIGANQLIANQGLLEMSNGAMLDNAKYAITFGADGTWDTFGGVVQANDATIKATRRAVAFMSYPGINSSYFNRCTFEYAGDFTAGKLPLVTLWANDGVKFYGCTFTDNTNRNIYSEYGNSGIFSMDAVYQVLPACPTGFQNCPTKTVRSSFNNLNQGVYALNDIAATNMVSVESADFNQNAIGFRVKATDGTRFIKNEVKNGGLVKSNFLTNPNLDFNHYYGYRSENAKDFTIEQNTFEKVAQGGVNEPTVGVNIKEAGRVANEVYNNTFKGQNIGQKFDGANRAAGSLGRLTGLSIKCNANPTTQSNINADIQVNLVSNLLNDGIKDNQYGSTTTQSAGNNFSSATWRIQSQMIPFIDYRYNSAQEDPVLNPQSPSSSGNVRRVSASAATCSPRFLIRNNLGHLQLPNNYVVDYYTKRANYDNLLYTLYQNIDGGNTDSLKEEINLYFPNEAQQMRNGLMQEAPYLSQEALMDAANTGILTDALLLEICLANPEATYGEEFLNFVEYEIPNPLPSNFITLIYQNWDTETTRTIIENQLSVLNDDLGLMGKNILNYYVEDTLDWTDSIENMIASKKNLPSKYDLVELAASQNNYTLANSRLTAIGNNYELNDAQWEEHNNLVAYITFRENKFNAGTNMMQLQANDLTELSAIANALPGRTAALARSVLCFGYQECESNFPQEPLGRKKKSYAQRTYDFENDLELSSRAESRGDKLAVYPNPTKSNFTIQMNEFDENANYLIELRSLDGKLLKEQVMLNQKLELSTNSLAAGSYLVVLLKNGERSAQTVLVKQ
jgi:hypothetical protein